MHFYKSSVSESITQFTWERIQDAQIPLYAFVAFNEAKELIGFAHVIYHASTWTKGDYAYLQDLFVSEKCRRGGVATALVHKVYTHATQKNASRVYWLTHENNKEARALYEKVAVRTGFIQYRKVLKIEP